MRPRRRRSLFPRLIRREKLEASEPLKGQLWTRSERGLKEPDVSLAWRGAAALAAAAEVGVFLWLWFGPLLAVQTVDVTGTHHLSAAQVEQAAGFGEGSSVISIDGTAGEQRLLSQTWVRTASVQTQLPGTIVIQISEWQPVAAYHSGKSTKLFWLSSQAVVRGSAPNDGGLVDIQGPAGAGGQAPPAGAAAGRADDRGEILDLPRDGVGRRVAAVAPAAAVVAVDGEPFRQQLGQLDLAGVAAVAEGAADQDHGVAGAGAVVGDRGPVW